MELKSTIYATEFTTSENAISVNNNVLYDAKLNLSQQCLGMEHDNEQFDGYSLASIVILIILTALFCLFAFVGNITVITAIKRDRVISKHKQNLYLLSLAVADALLVVFVVPFSLTNQLLGYWPFGDLYCRIYLSVDVLLSTASICNICCIGIDRFVSVTYPATYKRYRRMPRIRLAIISVWIYATAVSLLPFFGQTKILHGREDECFVNDSTWYIILSSSLSFFLPTFIIGPIYFKIFLIGKRLAATKRARHASRYQEEGCMKSPKTANRERNRSRSPSLWRSDAIRSPTSRSDQHTPMISTKHFKQRERNLVRSISLEAGKTRSIRCSRPEKSSKRSSAHSLDEKNWAPGQLLAPPAETHSPILKPKNTISTKNVDGRVKIIEVKKDSLNSEDSLPEEFSPLQNKIEDGTEAIANTYHCKRASLCDSGCFQEKSSKSNSFFRFFRACCAKFQRNNNNNSQPHIVILAPHSSYPKGNTSRKKRFQERLLSTSSFITNIRRHSALSRRASAMSTQSTCAGPSRRERRFIFIISVVTGCFMLCWSPFFVTYIIYAICRESCCINPVMFKAFFWIGYLNSAINPILYTIFNKDFRLAFKRLFQTRRRSW